MALQNFMALEMIRGFALWLKIDGAALGIQQGCAYKDDLVLLSSDKHHFKSFNVSSI
jgi:hypothetical protein